MPPTWSEALIIPIPKPGKDYIDPNNCHPIALTSCLGKTMERMVNNHLVYKLETGNKINRLHCGFRQGRSTLGHLLRLESYARDTFC